MEAQPPQPPPQQATSGGRVLIVDDDPSLLAAMSRNLRGRFDVVSAPDSKTAFSSVESNGPFAVILSDLRMPGMDGNALLAEMRKRSPDSVRILLTGQGDLDAAAKAINEGSVFRFLTKPCERDTLLAALDAAVTQHRLITAEKVLLQQTLNGCIRVLTDILSLVNPLAFGRAARISQYARQVAHEISPKDTWKCEIAAMLSQIGCVAVPTEIIEKSFTAQTLSEDEAKIFRSHMELGSSLIGKIPRLEEIAQTILNQEVNYDTKGAPAGTPAGKTLPVEQQILKAVLDFDRLETSGIPRTKALATMRGRAGLYAPAVLSAMDKLQSIEREDVVKPVPVRQLARGMVIAQDVTTESGLLLVSRGQEVTEAMIQRLVNYRGGGGVKEPVAVRLAPSPQEGEAPESKA